MKIKLFLSKFRDVTNWILFGHTYSELEPYIKLHKLFDIKNKKDLEIDTGREMGLL